MTTPEERRRAYRDERLRRTEDCVFTDDGQVRLPKLAGLALGMAVRSGGPLSNQPTQERATAVAEAMTPLAADKGMALSVVETPRGRWLVRVAVPA